MNVLPYIRPYLSNKCQFIFEINFQISSRKRKKMSNPFQNGGGGGRVDNSDAQQKLQSFWPEQLQEVLCVVTVAFWTIAFDMYRSI